MSDPARVVVVGGGFAGAFTAKYLRRYGKDAVSVELINADNYFVFQPLLPEVASGTISAPDAVTPLRYMLPGIRFRMAEVVDIDRDHRRVHVRQGSRRIPQSVAYDHLVLAIGQETNLSQSPGFEEHSLRMRSLADAHQLRNKVIRRLEHADITEDSALKRQLLTFVVAGGGFSGVETIGELAEMIDRTLKFYPRVKRSDIRCVLVQWGDNILQELPAKLGNYARKRLEARGIEILCNRRVVSATGSSVRLDDDSTIPCCLLVTTVGNGPTAFCRRLGFELERGRIPVDASLAVKGADNVWALGDAALVPITAPDGAVTGFAPPTAQFAVRQARCVARNVANFIAGRPLSAFAYKPRGSMASIGHYQGVAEIFGVRLSGLLAWLIWRAFYIGMLPGFATRLRVALNWLFDYFLPRSIVQIENRLVRAVTYRRYAKGDVISRPGQYVDGFYTITDGYLESRIPGEQGAEDFVRVLGPGDHWGEKSLSGESLTVGTLAALEDARVMILPAKDFRDLRNAFPALDDYFSHISEKIYAPDLRHKKDRN